VIATDPDAKNGPLFDPERRLWDPRDILNICSSLVTITFREDSSNEGSIGDRDSSRVLSSEPGTIKLAHFSVREYLISEHLRMNTPGLSCYYFNEKIAHVSMAKTSLAYLLQFDQKDDVNSTILRSYPLSRYATHNWMDHAGWDPAGDLDDLHGLIMMLLEPTSAVYINWVRLYCQHNPRESNRMDPLYIAAEAGLERACQDLLLKRSDMSGCRRYGDTPLNVAAFRGHDTIVQLLLENGADVNAQGGTYGNALQAAASGGHGTIAQLLLTKGADVNAWGGQYWSALQAAAFKGHGTIVRLFLENGADVNAQGGEYESALQAAVVGGHDVIVSLLLETAAAALKVNPHMALPEVKLVRCRP
jgi:Ankyrin repeats (3 copies)